MEFTDFHHGFTSGENITCSWWSSYWWFNVKISRSRFVVYFFRLRKFWPFFSLSFYFFTSTSYFFFYFYTLSLLNVCICIDFVVIGNEFWSFFFLLLLFMVPADQWGIHIHIKILLFYFFFCLSCIRRNSKEKFQWVNKEKIIIESKYIIISKSPKMTAHWNKYTAHIIKIVSITHTHIHAF